LFRENLVEWFGLGLAGVDKGVDQTKNHMTVEGTSIRCRDMRGKRRGPGQRLYNGEENVASQAHIIMGGGWWTAGDDRVITPPTGRR
jgi:hypothetical protein